MLVLVARVMTGHAPGGGAGFAVPGHGRGRAAADRPPDAVLASAGVPPIMGPTMTIMAAQAASHIGRSPM